jgi:ABC-type transporter Mla MlaB component
MADINEAGMSNGSAGGQPLRLGPATIRNVTSLQAELAGRLDESGSQQLDGGGAERVDTAVLQLLAAFVRDMRADGRQVEWIGCSTALQRSAAALGLEAELGLNGNNH